jgi:futalosine hydrolase
MSQCIIAATDIEMAILLKELHCDREVSVMGFDIYRSKGYRHQISVMRSGPGVANAAAAAALAIEKLCPERIFNIGVCGVYSDDAALLGRVVAGTSAVFADAGVDSDNGFLSMKGIELPLATLDDGKKIYNIVQLQDDDFPKTLHRGMFFTLSACSGDRDRAEKVKHRFETGKEELVCEDMETAAVAFIAQKAQISCSVLRGISNLCGERNYKAWKLNEAAEAAQNELLNHL